MTTFFDSIRQQLGYMLSLPERTIRSLAALAGGSTTLLGDMLFPDVLKGSALYKVFIGDTQRFVVEKVAQVQREVDQKAGPITEDATYIPRKMVGSALEAAGLFALHLSPLWVLAFAADVAGGGNVFLSRLVEQLKCNGVIPKQMQINNVTDLLAAIQDSSRTSAAVVDTPPLSREEISRLSSEVFANYQKMFQKAGNLMPRLESIWQRMEDMSKRENISLERLSGLLTIDVASWGKKSIGAVWAVGQTGSDLLGEKILSTYGKTLDDMSQQGVSNYVGDKMKPFLEAAATHFNPDKKTWTENFLQKIGEVREPITDKTSPQDNIYPDNI